MATTAAAASVIPSLTERPIKNTICLFDVDGTLTPVIKSHPPSLVPRLPRSCHAACEDVSIIKCTLLIANC
jgi:phosphomannomutase